MRRAASIGAGTPPSAPVFVTLSGSSPTSSTAAALLTKPPPPPSGRSRRSSSAAAAATPVAAAAARPPPSSSSSTSSSPTSPSSSPTTSSTPTTVGDIGPAPIGAATVVESFSAGPSDSSTWRTARAGPSSMHARCWQHRCVPSSTTCPRAWQAWSGASSTSTSSVYACPMLATPMRAFVHDVSPGLANPARRVVNNVFLPAHHYFDTTAPMTNSAPPCARGSTATSSTPATPTRHRPRHSSHGYLVTATPPPLSATSTTAQRATTSLEQLDGFLYSPRVRYATPSTTLPLRLRGDVSPSAAILSSLTVRDAHVVRNATATTAGGC